jgi:hypothetical protein
LSGRRRSHDDDVRLEAQAIGGEGWKALAPAIGGDEIVDGDGFPIHIAEGAQAWKNASNLLVCVVQPGSNVRKHSRGVFLADCASAAASGASVRLSARTSPIRRMGTSPEDGWRGV